MRTGKRYREEQIIKVLKGIDAGARIASVARTHGVTDHTIFRWREKFGMSQSELAEMKAMKEENRRIRHGVARLSLDLAATNEIAKRNWRASRRESGKGLPFSSEAFPGLVINGQSVFPRMAVALRRKWRSWNL